MESFNRNDRLPHLERILFQLAEGKITDKKTRTEYDKDGEIMKITITVTERLPDSELVLFLLSKYDPFYSKDSGRDDIEYIYDPDANTTQNKAD
jgi:hypothetical protein